LGSPSCFSAGAAVTAAAQAHRHRQEQGYAGSGQVRDNSALPAKLSISMKTPATHPPGIEAPAAGSVHVAPTRDKRIWALALGTAAIWYLDPALAEMAELVGGIACASNKSLVRDEISNMRRKAGALRRQVGPLPASALSKVVRRTEAASGAVLDKGARMKELQLSWDQFLACLRSSPKR
jgi:hypothetical protein